MTDDTILVREIDGQWIVSDLYRELDSAATALGFQMRYWRKRTDPFSPELKNASSEYTLTLVDPDSHECQWHSSNANPAEVVAELQLYLKTLDPSDPGLARAAEARAEAAEMVEQIVAWATERVGDDD